MKLSIVIVSWNVRELLKKCLESILKYESDANYANYHANDANGARIEVVVVDNGSEDGTVEMLENFKFPSQRMVGPWPKSSNFKIIANNKNLGFAKANNQGIAQTKGEYILLLNPDTEFIEDNTLQKCVAQMEADKKACPEYSRGIGVLGCQLLNSDKTIQPSVRAFPRVRDVVVILFKLHKLFPWLLDRYLARDFDYAGSASSTPPSNSPLGEGGEFCVEVDQVMGAFFLVRRRVFEQIGLLDEKYFIWFEEVDFCRRARNNGWKVVYYPHARIIHHVGQSFAQRSSLKKQYWFFKSALHYFLRV